MADRFFFYGTLMDEAVRLAVLGPKARTLSFVPATLDGWRRGYARARHYPVVVAARGRTVVGLLAANVDRDAARRLDRFEGAEYVRRQLAVRLDTGDSETAWIYVARDPAMATTQDWDFEDWRRRHREAFLKRLAGGAGAA